MLSTKVCIFPSMGHWELKGKPVSHREADYGRAPGVIWKPSEVADNLKHGYIFRPQ